MKILSKMLWLAAFAVLFTSCESDDDVLPAEAKPVEIKIAYSYENTAEFFRYVDVEIVYLDKSGKEQKADLSNYSWKYEETLDYASAPSNYACKIVAKKTGVVPETEKCIFQGMGSYAISVTCIYNDGSSRPLGSCVNRQASAGENNIVKALELIPDEGKVLYEYNYTLEK